MKKDPNDRVLFRVHDKFNRKEIEDTYSGYFGHL